MSLACLLPTAPCLAWRSHTPWSCTRAFPFSLCDRLLLFSQPRGCLPPPPQACSPCAPLPQPPSAFLSTPPAPQPSCSTAAPAGPPTTLASAPPGPPPGGPQAAAWGPSADVTCGHPCATVPLCLPHLKPVFSAGSYETCPPPYPRRAHGPPWPDLTNGHKGCYPSAWNSFPFWVQLTTALPDGSKFPPLSSAPLLSICDPGDSPTFLAIYAFFPHGPHHAKTWV